MTLLEIPIASILGIATTILTGIIGYFIRDAYTKLTSTNLKLEEKIDELKDKLNTEIRQIEDKVSKSQFHILEKIQEAKNVITNDRK